MLEQVDIHKENNCLDPYLTPYTLTHSKCIPDLSVKAKTMKLPEENKGEKSLPFLWLGRDFCE
jgi:hypothetical protein